MTQRLQYTELAPEGLAALRAVEHYVNTDTALEPVLTELVRLRASLLNGCGYCIGLHTHELKKQNETEGRIGAVAKWEESDAFTERERAALAWADAITKIQDGHASDEAYAAVQVHFRDGDLVNLTLTIASINAWNRMAIAFRAEERRVFPAAPQPTTPAGKP